MTLKTILQPLKPFQLIGLISSYLLGAGLVQYVNPLIDVDMMVQGGLFLLTFIIALDYLCGLQSTLKFDLWEDTSEIDLIRIRWAYRIIAAFFVTFSTSLFVGWMVQGSLEPAAAVLWVVNLIIGMFYYLAQVHENLQPYQVLFEVILVVFSPPLMAFFLQSGSVHRFLTMSVVVLIPLYLSYRLLEDLVRFDLGSERQTDALGTKLGWDNMMILHNALILTGYALLAFMTLLGLPWFITWPVFLGLPIGLVEIWLMERVRRGYKPLWRIMQIATASTFLISAYFLAFAFWSR
ncbi:MAG: hypothetical protein ABIJ42_02450 [Acidobacteriota bacterium]